MQDDDPRWERIEVLAAQAVFEATGIYTDLDSARYDAAFNALVAWVEGEGKDD